MPQQVLGDMIVRIVGDNVSFDKSIDTSEKKLSSFNGKLKTVGDSMKKFGDQATRKLTLPIIAAGTAMAKMAIDAEETASKFATVFKSVSAQADATAKNLAKNYGLSGTAAKKLLGDTGDLLTGFGFSAEGALDLSKQVNELAVDLASFTNYAGGAAGASAALTKGLLGETEGLKALGIAISQAEIERLAEEKGIVGELDRQTKAALTLELALKQSKNAIGDFARTQDSAANQARVLQADLQDMAEEFGKELIPIVKDAIKFARDLIADFAGLDDNSKRLILQIAGVTAAIGPLSKGVGVLTGAFSVMAAHPVAATIIALAAGFIALGVAIKGAIDEAEKFKKVQEGTFTNFGKVSEIIAGTYKPSLEEATKIQKELNYQHEESNKKITKLKKTIKDLSDAGLSSVAKKLQEELKAWETQNVLITKSIELLDTYIEKKKEATDPTGGKDKEKRLLEISEKEKLEMRIQGELAYSEFLKEEEEKRKALKDKAAEQENKRIEEEKKKRKELMSFYVGAVGNALGALTELGNSRLAQIEQERDAEGNLSKTLLEEKKKILTANKAIAVIQSVISGVGAVLKTFEQFGYPAGIIPAAIMGGIAAAQTAAIIATPLPKLADGGLVLPQQGGQRVIMAEAGVPEYAVPERKDVMTRLADRIVEQMSRPNVTNIQNSTQNLPGKLSIDGKDFKLWMTDEMRKGNIIVPKRAIR